LRFHALPAPSVEDIAQLADRVANRIERLLRKSGRVVDDQLQEQALQDEQTVLLSCYHAAAQGIELAGAQAGQRSLRLVSLPVQPPRSPRRQGLVAEVRGVNIHAETVVDGRDRKRLQRLCRYVARPPLCQDRLESLSDGRLRYCMKKPWSDGTVALLFDPLSFIARLCALIPPPRFHMLRYAGVLAAHSTLRSKVVPVAGSARESSRSPFEQMLLFSDAPLMHKGRSLEPAASKQTPRSGDRSGSQSRHLWAVLLLHVFEHDVMACVHCEGRMRVVEIATTPKAIQRVLANAGAAARAPPARAPPRSPALSAQLRLPLG
jgi:hypothetical protein